MEFFTEYFNFSSTSPDSITYVVAQMEIPVECVIIDHRIIPQLQVTMAGDYVLAITSILIARLRNNDVTITLNQVSIYHSCDCNLIVTETTGNLITWEDRLGWISGQRALTRTIFILADNTSSSMQDHT